RRAVAGDLAGGADDAVARIARRGRAAGGRVGAVDVAVVVVVLEVGAVRLGRVAGDGADAVVVVAVDEVVAVVVPPVAAQLVEHGKAEAVALLDRADRAGVAVEERLASLEAQAGAHRLGARATGAVVVG